MWYLATAHAQTLHSGWAYTESSQNTLVQDFKAKERMDVDSRWAYFRKGTVVIKPPQVHVHADTLVEVPKLHNIRLLPY